MIGILDGLKIGASVALGAALCFYPAKYLGEQEGKRAASLAALEKSINNLRERNVLDEQITSADAAALCDDFGLSDEDERECMRRLETHASE